MPGRRAGSGSSTRAIRRARARLRKEATEKRIREANEKAVARRESASRRDAATDAERKDARKRVLDKKRSDRSREVAKTKPKPKREGSGMFGTGIGPSEKGWNAIKKIGSEAAWLGGGVAEMGAEYGTAFGRDTRNLVPFDDHRGTFFGNTGKLVGRDVLGLGATANLFGEALGMPQPWDIDIDPEKFDVSIRKGRPEKEEVQAARDLLREHPSTLLVAVPFVNRLVKTSSITKIANSIRKENPEMSRWAARRIAAKETKRPGYAARHDIAGGIPQRNLKGKYFQQPARAPSKSAIGRAGQGLYDKASDVIEKKAKPGARFSTSQRAGRMYERSETKKERHDQARWALEEMTMRKGIGHLLPGKKKPFKEALIAALEGPDNMTPRSAVRLKIEYLTNLGGASNLKQVAILEKSLIGKQIDSPEFMDAVHAAARLSDELDASSARVLGMTKEELDDRRDLVVRRYEEMFLLPPNASAKARGYFPHQNLLFKKSKKGGGRHSGQAVIGQALHGTEFEVRENQLWNFDKSKVSNEPRLLGETLRERAVYERTVRKRQRLFDAGSPVVKGHEVPENMDNIVVVRDPLEVSGKLDSNFMAAIGNPKQHQKLRKGHDPETLLEWAKEWMWKGDGTKPTWLSSQANVRVVPEGIARAVLLDIFAAAPRGSIASFFGAINALARTVTIYLPYAGVRYVARNTPQNIILLALSNPKAFFKWKKTIHEYRVHHKEDWERIKVESGTIPAAAGLPDLPSRKKGRMQTAEHFLVENSRKISNKQGDIADEPWRGMSWFQYADDYDFKTPEQIHELLTSNKPEIVQVRENIAQYVREDMLDFDALTPFERERLSRFFFILPFQRAALKWPFMYAREYPTRAAVISLLAGQHAREKDKISSVWDQGKAMVGGTLRDLGWLDPSSPSRGSIETMIKIAKASPGGPKAMADEFSQFLSPQYRQIWSNQGWEGLGKALLPGYTTVDKLGKGGGLVEQIIRMLGATTELSKTRVDDRRKALETDMKRIGRDDAIKSPHIVKAFALQDKLVEATDGKDGKDKTIAAIDLAEEMKLFTPEYAEARRKQVEGDTDHMADLMLGRISDHVFGGNVLSASRSAINDILEARKLEPTDY